MTAILPTSGPFASLAASAPDAIFTIDENSRILFANAASEAVFGYTPSELLGMRLTDLIPERLRAAHEAGLARYIRSGKRNIPWTGVELPGLRKDGSEVPLEISFGEFVGEDGRRIFSGFMRDVSERTRQQMEVQDARARAEAALSELAAVGRVMDLALASATYDRMMRELLAGLRRELRADTATVLLLDDESSELIVQATDGIELDPSVRIPVDRGLPRQIAQSERSLVVEDLSTVEVMHPALRQIVSLLAVPLRADEALIGVLHVGTRTRREFSPADVRLLELVAGRMSGGLARTRLYQAERAARRDAEEARAALQQQERELLRLNEQLELRRREAEDAARSREEVLSIVSHDLRNPVNTVMMSASLLSDPTFTLDEAQRQKQLDIIQRSAERMSRLIQDLLDVARMEGGRLPLSLDLVDAVALARETVESFRPIAKQKSVTIACEAEDALPSIHADRDRIIQALSNYLSNAVKFSPDGARVQVRVRRGDHGVRFDVVDEGPGLTEETLANVFARFWQAERTAHMGSGLGLAIVKGIVESHGGRAWASNGRAGGGCFSFEIPAAGSAG